MVVCIVCVPCGPGARGSQERMLDALSGVGNHTWSLCRRSQLAVFAAGHFSSSASKN